MYRGKCLLHFFMYCTIFVRRRCPVRFCAKKVLHTIWYAEEAGLGVGPVYNQCCKYEFSKMGHGLYIISQVVGGKYLCEYCLCVE